MVVSDISEQMPENFSSDEEMAAWFESVDLSSYRLERALDVEIAEQVTLTIEDDFSAGSMTAAAAGESTLTYV
jgi:hypothetical protein